LCFRKNGLDVKLNVVRENTKIGKNEREPKMKKGMILVTAMVLFAMSGVALAAWC